MARKNLFWKIFVILLIFNLLLTTDFTDSTDYYKNFRDASIRWIQMGFADGNLYQFDVYVFQFFVGNLFHL